MPLGKVLTDEAVGVFIGLARASVSQNVKGELPVQIEIYGEENNVCQETRLEPGKYLVFLSRDSRGRFRSSNYQMSVRPIRKGSVQWYIRSNSEKDFYEHYGYSLKWRPLETILRRVVALTGRPSPRAA